MNEETQATEIIATNEELLPKEIDTLPLDKSTQEIVEKIIKEDNVDNLKDLTRLFNTNQVKKNLLRVVKLNNLLDKVNDQAIERFEKRPDEISNKELLDYMQVVQTSIEKSQKSIEQIDTSPMIQINNNTNEINVNMENQLDRDSKERVLDVVQKLIKFAQQPQVIDVPDDPKVVNLDEISEGAEEYER